LILHDSSFPLAQCTRLDAGEPFGVVARFDVVDACFKSEDILDEVHDLDKTLFEGSSDMFMHEESPRLGCNNIFPNPLGRSHVSPICSLPSPSPEHYLDEPLSNRMIFDASIELGYENNRFNVLGGNVDDYVSLGYFRGYDPSIGPYCVCLEDFPRKITWTTFFNHFYNFFMGFDKVKRILNPFGVILVGASYLVFSNFSSQQFDKLLHVLTAFDLMSRVLTA